MIRLSMLIAKRLLAVNLEKLQFFVSKEPAKPWPVQYHDLHPYCATIEVDSRQLNIDTTKSSRYQELRPTRLCLVANQDSISCFCSNRIEDSYTRLQTNNLLQYVKRDSPRLASKVSTSPRNYKHSASKQQVHAICDLEILEKKVDDVECRMKLAHTLC
jgi:hypothetical protein